MVFSPKYFPFLLLVSFLYFNCKTESEKNDNSDQQLNNKQSIDSNLYNLEIIPTTKIECSFLTNRPVYDTIENEPYYVDTSYQYRLMSIKGMNHKNRVLWPCNLPDILKQGDSVLVSATLYATSGDEKILGVPAMITKILMNDNYKNGLSNLFKK